MVKFAYFSLGGTLTNRPEQISDHQKVSDGWGGSRHLKVVNPFAWCQSWSDLRLQLKFETKTTPTPLETWGGPISPPHPLETAEGATLDRVKEKTMFF